MKKLIVFAVVFALLAGAAFAQVQIDAGGAAKMGILEINTQNTKDAKNNGEKAFDAVSTSFDSWFWVAGKKTNDDGTMGAKGSFSIGTSNWGQSTKDAEAGGDDHNHDYDAVGFDLNGGTYFYIWWQPIEQVFIKMGKIGEDGKYWAGAGVVGWDFQSNDLLMSPAFDYYNGFAGSMLADSHGYIATTMGDRTGLQISVLPIDGLAINLGWEMGAGSFKQTFWEGLNAQVVYSISGAGTAAIGFVNRADPGWAYWGLWDSYRQLAAQYHHPINDKMKVEAGAKMWLRTNKDLQNKGPIDIGLGFGYGSPWGDTFWLNARIGASIGMKTKWTGYEVPAPTIIGVDICPSYDLGAFRVYVPVGVAMSFLKDADTLFAWSVNPYIRKSMGGLEFWAGIKLFNGANGGVSRTHSQPWGYYGSGGVTNKDEGKQINFSIPVGMLWSW